MGAAKLIRFAVLISFAGLFVWLSYVRGELLWLMPSLIFAAFSVFVLRR
jgi:hypothetical protein